MKHYYELIKSGLIFGNIVPVIAGFVLASKGHPIDIELLATTLAGIFLVIASGCVFNNYLDTDIDARMERTKHRALVHGKIPSRHVIAFGVILGVLGFLTLGIFTNFLTLFIAVIGFFYYIFLYTLLFKRLSPYGTFVGAVAGATPPVIGYCAVSDRFDMAAVILFFIMVVWQMPHFFAIAIRRREDYTAAHIPVMPVRNGLRRTKVSMLIYIVEFIIAASLLAVFGYVGKGYLVVVTLLGYLWLFLCIKGFWVLGTAAHKQWARTMFFFSLIVMMTLFITIIFSALGG
jgi:protoheme IX farnesyltransferase